MAETKSIILNHQKIEQKINRIAYQIYEDHYDQKDLIIAGIVDNGLVLAELIVKKLKKISDLNVRITPLKIDKRNPLKREIEIEVNEKDLENQTIIIIDDVLNSGKTMMYAIKPFLSIPVRKIGIAVLVDRSHKRFPVNADYVGMSLATTLKEHIEVKLEKGNYGAYLS